MLTKLGKSSTIFGVALVLLMYWAIAPFVSISPLIEWLRAAQLVISLSVAILYLPGLVEILFVRAPSQVQQLVFGIVIAWAGGAGISAWLGLWRMAGRPEWMLDSAISGFFTWMICVGGFLHLTAPRAIDGRIPRANWAASAFALVASLALAWVLLVVPPDVRWIADWLEPYLSSSR